MRKDDSVKRDLARASKSVEQIAEVMTRVKACKATYVLETKVRTVENGLTVVKMMTTYHQNRKSGFSRMATQYLEITGTELKTRDAFVHYESGDGTVVATFELYKPAVG